MEITVNYLAIVAAAISSIVVGSLWFGPLFGKMWISLMGFTPEQIEEGKKRGMAKSYIGSVVAGFVTAFVLAHFAAVWQMVDAVSVYQLPFWLWLGFIVTSMSNTVFWEGKPLKLYLLNIGHQFVSLAVMAAILIYWPF